MHCYFLPHALWTLLLKNNKLKVSIFRLAFCVVVFEVQKGEKQLCSELQNPWSRMNWTEWWWFKFLKVIVQVKPSKGLNLAVVLAPLLSFHLIYIGVQTKLHIEWNNKDFSKVYIHIDISNDKRSFGVRPKANPWGLSPKRTISYHVWNSMCVSNLPNNIYTHW